MQYSDISTQHVKCASNNVDIPKMHNLLFYAALLITIVIIYITDNNKFIITALLPFSYAIYLKLFLSGTRARCNLPSVLFVYVYFFRMCILPLVTAMGGYFIGGAEEHLGRYYIYSILLMTFE